MKESPKALESRVRDTRKKKRGKHLKRFVSETFVLPEPEPLDHRDAAIKKLSQQLATVNTMVQDTVTGLQSKVEEVSSLKESKRITKKMLRRKEVILGKKKSEEKDRTRIYRACQGIEKYKLLLLQLQG